MQHKLVCLSKIDKLNFSLETTQNKATKSIKNKSKLLRIHNAFSRKKNKEENQEKHQRQQRQGHSSANYWSKSKTLASTMENASIQIKFLDEATKPSKHKQTNKSQIYFAGFFLIQFHTH